MIIIGSDESLKGDTFGGLVAAGVKADDKLREELDKLGVRDSKKIADRKILLMAKRIKGMAEYKVRAVFPEEYNKSELTLTPWLNKLHQECYDHLKPGKHVVDKYPGCDVGEVVEEKAEDKYVEVAAASILARAAALEQMDKLSVKAGFELLRGSTHVKSALLELKKRGLDFKEFVKMDFKNVKEFLENDKN